MQIPDIRQPSTLLASIRSAVRATVDDAVRLGLVWRLRPGTIYSSGNANPNATPVIVDGDNAQMIGRSWVGPLANGQRVWCLFVPPAGVYIVGIIGRNATIPGVSTFTATGAGTWTKPAGLSWARVRVQGGGGQCGGAQATGAGQASEGAGGGGGGYAESIYDAGALPPTVATNVGIGGSIGGAGANGQNGGITTFGTLMTGNGGGGGGLGSASAGNTASSGGNGGTATGGNVINIRGGDGGNGGVFSGETLRANNGASSFLASEVATSAFSSSGQAGYLYGGGGGSTRNNDSEAARPGAAGASGIIVVEEYYR